MENTSTEIKAILVYYFRMLSELAKLLTEMKQYLTILPKNRFKCCKDGDLSLQIKCGSGWSSVIDYGALKQEPNSQYSKTFGTTGIINN